MHLILLFVQLALAVVFAVAGTAKIFDWAGTRASLQNFGAPERLASTLAGLLPACELAIAAGLMFTITSWIAGVFALVLLAVFLVVIGVSIGRGHTHDCHCFGQLYSRPISTQTIVRNVLFAIGAVFVVWAGRREPAGWPVPASVVLLVLVVAVVAYRYRKQTSSHAPIALSSGLPVGSPAPAFELPDYEDGTQSLRTLLAPGKRLLLIFTSPFCGPCVHLFQEVASWQRAHGEEIRVVIISRGTIKENFVNTVKNGLQNVLLQQRSEVAELYQAKVTPTAVVVEPSGRIGSLLSAGADEIRALLRDVLRVQASPSLISNDPSVSENFSRAELDGVSLT
ncbi:MAG TPA: MauE/DoxX family redox-associated membrane protein [Pyrinomonadaceae bacterium]